MLNKSMKTVALAASLVTMLAACDKNHSNGNKNNNASLTAAGEKQVSADVLQTVIGQIDSSYSSKDTGISSKIAAIGINTNRGNKNDNAAMGAQILTGLLQVSIQLKGSDDVIALASLEDASTLQSGQVVELTVSDDAALTAALGSTPSVRVKCLEAGCNRLALLLLTRKQSAENGAINSQRAEAGFIFNRQQLEHGQEGVEDLNRVQKLPSEAASS